jgi:hypothetical protein
MLTNFDLTNVREVSANAFRKSGIASADLPNCTKLDTKAFYNCESLNYVNIPKSISFAIALLKRITKRYINVRGSNNIDISF